MIDYVKNSTQGLPTRSFLQDLLDFSLGRASSNGCHEIIAQQNEGIIFRSYYAPTIP